MPVRTRKQQLLDSDPMMDLGRRERRVAARVSFSDDDEEPVTAAVTSSFRDRSVSPAPHSTHSSPSSLSSSATVSNRRAFLAAEARSIYSEDDSSICSEDAPLSSSTPPRRQTTALKRAAEEEGCPLAKKARVSSKSEERLQLRRSARIAKRRQLDQAQVQQARRNTRFSAAQQAVLKKAFDLSPYLDSETKVQVAEEADMTQAQVKTWFGNKRYREKQRDKVAQKPSQVPGKVSLPKQPRIGMKKRQPRTTFTQVQLKFLEEVFSYVQFPNKDELTDFAECTFLPETTIRAWFMNRRAKCRRDNKG